MIKSKHYPVILLKLFILFYPSMSFSQGVIFEDVYLLGQLEIDNFPTTTSSIEGSLNIFSSQPQSEITDLTPLNNLKSITQSLAIHYCDSLKSLSGLENLKTVGGSLEIISNSSLNNLDGLSSIDTVGGNLYISNNNSLSSFCGLYNLLSSNGLVGLFNVSYNLTNPTQQAIINSGPCITTDVVEDNNRCILNAYSLKQNYPNPFNPVTTINYQLSEGGFASLIVYDVLGKEIKVLVNEYKAKGQYESLFDGSKLASGIYYYKISVNDFTDIKNMALIK